MAGISKVAIANLALSMLGEYRITALTDDTNPARAISTWYDQARKATLRAHPWNFVTRRADLTMLGDTPEYGFSYYYGLPTGFLRLLDFNPVTKDPYRLESVSGHGIALATSASDAVIKFIIDDDDPVHYDPLFIIAFAAKLAMAAQVQVTGTSDSGLRADLERRYNFALNEARSVDAFENPPQQPDWQDDFISAYMGGATYRPIEDSS